MEQQIHNVLGLDVSSTVVGYTVMNSEYDVEDIGWIPFKKDWTLIEKSLGFREIMMKLHEKFDIKRVAIEDILTKFIAGKSSIKTIITLSQFNMLAQYHVYEVFGIEPVLINVLRARNLSECKVPRGINSKEFVFNKVSQWYPEIEWPRMKRKKDKFAKECYDMADSCVVAKAVLKMEEPDGGYTTKVLCSEDSSRGTSK